MPPPGCRMRACRAGQTRQPAARHWIPKGDSRGVAPCCGGGGRRKYIGINDISIYLCATISNFRSQISNLVSRRLVSRNMPPRPACHFDPLGAFRLGAMAPLHRQVEGDSAQTLVAGRRRRGKGSRVGTGAAASGLVGHRATEIPGAHRFDAPSSVTGKVFTGETFPRALRIVQSICAIAIPSPDRRRRHHLRYHARAIPVQPVAPGMCGAQGVFRNGVIGRISGARTARDKGRVC